MISISTFTAARRKILDDDFGRLRMLMRYLGHFTASLTVPCQQAMHNRRLAYLSSVEMTKLYNSMGVIMPTFNSLTLHKEDQVISNST